MLASLFVALYRLDAGFVERLDLLDREVEVQACEIVL
jgi:hypothetical protein